MNASSNVPVLSTVMGLSPIQHSNASGYQPVYPTDYGVDMNNFFAFDNMLMTGASEKSNDVGQKTTWTNPWADVPSSLGLYDGDTWDGWAFETVNPQNNGVSYFHYPYVEIRPASSFATTLVTASAHPDAYLRAAAKAVRQNAARAAASTPSILKPGSAAKTQSGSAFFQKLFA